MSLVSLVDAPYLPALGCDTLVTTWCSACCPSDEPLLPRMLTKTAIVLKSGRPLFFWGCWAASQLADPMSELNARAANDESLSSRSCGILSEREPRRYKSAEQRILEHSVRKCVAARKAAGVGANLSEYAPIGLDRQSAITSFKAECKAVEEGQLERRAVMVAKGLFNFPYPPANGCDERLLDYCRRVCPKTSGAAEDILDDPAAFVPRKIVRAGRAARAGDIRVAGGNGEGVARTFAWGCFPRNQLLAAPPPRYARLRRGGGPTCGSGNSSTVDAIQEDLAAIATVCLAKTEARSLRKELVRHPLAVRERPVLVPSTLGNRPTSAATPHNVVSNMSRFALLSSTGGFSCSETAYVSVLTVSTSGNTFMSGAAGGALRTNASSATRLQWALMLTLARSLRRHESPACIRDFVLLLGSDVMVPRGMMSAFHELRILVARITSLDPAIPPLDHLHAWR